MNGSAPTAGQEDHVVVFYAGEREFSEAAGEFLCGALWTGGVAVVIATPDHHLLVRAWLEHAGIDVAAAKADGSYVELDAAATLASFMINGWPDPAAFWQVISPVIQPMRTPDSRLSVCPVRRLYRKTARKPARNQFT